MTSVATLTRDIISLMGYLVQEAFDLFRIASDLWIGQYGRVEHLYSACHCELNWGECNVKTSTFVFTCTYSLTSARSTSFLNVPVSPVSRQQQQQYRHG